MSKLQLVDQIADSFQIRIKNEFSKRLTSFYIVGSYAFEKTSEQRPDVNYLLIFEDFTSPDNYFQIGEICKKVEEEFAKKATVKFEFRPFRYIKPRYKNDFEVSVNPIITSTAEIKKMGNVIFNKWFTQGLISANKLITGNDFLSTLKVPTLKREDLKENSLMFFYLPLSRAPAQYSKEESNLLLNEALVNAKNTAYFGIEAAMTDEELANKEYVKYMENKETMVEFYQERYNQKTANIVSRILEVRSNYLQVKDDPKIAKEMFSIALDLINVVRSKVYSK